jgi:hypothetical protein
LHGDKKGPTPPTKFALEEKFLAFAFAAALEVGPELAMVLQPH